MKKNAVVTGALIALAVLLAAFGALCGAVTHVAADPNFYARDSRLAVAQYMKLDVGEGGLSEEDEAVLKELLGLEEAA